jgi:hypothetical protein
MITEIVEYRIMVIWHESSGLESVWDHTYSAKEIGRLLVRAVERHPQDRFWIRKTTTIDISTADIEKFLVKET